MDAAAITTRQEQTDRLVDLAREARADALAMITLAGSGHPGGSLSSTDILVALWSRANTGPEMVDDPARDRIIISHGHIAAAVYATLGRFGFFEPAEAIASFRRAGSRFEGHVDPKVPGIEWACGNLGQGLSAACGFALASRMTGLGYHVYCVMGDGEQQKGQIAEARRFAVKHGLSHLTAIVDCNDLQATGSVANTMPMDIAAEWRSAGWRVVEVDGHNLTAICDALEEAKAADGAPTVILARTVMGKGVPYIEGCWQYHGKPLACDECAVAIQGLGVTTDRLTLRDGGIRAQDMISASWAGCPIAEGQPRTYTNPTDCRTAFGNALADVAKANEDVPVAVFDCDLSPSVKTDEFARIRHEGFFQCGIQEHSTATIAGAIAKCGVLSVFAGFGVFALDEAFNQHRMNAINGAPVKVVCTHCGLDVGEDGKTHQCIDYIGLAASIYGARLIIPGDANQTDRVIRYVSAEEGMFIVAMGRSKVPILTRESGEPLYDADYAFAYGNMELIRQGRDATIITAGNLLAKAVAIAELLAGQGISIGVMNLTCPLDIDEPGLAEAAATRLIVTYEDHNVRTGIGSLVASRLAQSGLGCNLLTLGVKRYGVSGTPEANYRLQGLDVNSAAEAILDRLRSAGSSAASGDRSGDHYVVA